VILRILSLLSIFSLLTFGVRAEEAATDATFDHLSKVSLFSFSGGGYGGTQTDGERDFREILARSTAREDFLKLFEQENPQAKCYALVGIWKLSDRKTFIEFAAPHRRNMTSVNCAIGTMNYKAPIFGIIETILEDRYKVFIGEAKPAPISK